MEGRYSEGGHLILSHLIDKAGVGYIEIDTGFRITLWNKGAQNLLGYDEGSVLGRRLDDIIPVEEQELCRYDTAGSLRIFHTGSQSQPVHCEIHFSAIIDFNGETSGTALLMTEIRDVRDERVQSSLKARGNSMEDILGFAPVGIFHVGLDGNLSMANSESAWMLGYESSDHLVQAVADFAGQVFYDDKTAEEFMFILMEAERINRFRCQLKRKDGTFIWTLCYAMLTVDPSGRTDGFNGYAIDIGDTIRAESGLQKANEELMRLSVMDGLTQIANRRQFDTHLNKEWKQQMGTGKSLSVILCDIDHFKLFNDTYGHQAGDDCLKQVAQAINVCARENRGHAARYGGEEFGIILPGTGPVQAAAVAEKIRVRVLALAIEHEQSETHAHVTLSLGVGTVVPKKDALDMELLAAADAALYRAKEQGRNRVLSG